ncbi:hypothetical protein [Rhizorhabdus argentea]|uniref:hypothetical protein n=1 Tax=Rhizorhabdus argentea TaxID=1387174 RepID=UPI0030EEB000
MTPLVVSAPVALVPIGMAQHFQMPSFLRRGSGNGAPQRVQRGVADGYVYFLINAAMGLVVTTAFFAAIIKLTTINYLIVRVLGVAGLVMFLLNATLNFRRL